MTDRDQYFNVLDDLVHYRCSRSGDGVSFKTNFELKLALNFTFNILSVGFSKDKWRNLVYSYIEPRSFRDFVSSCKRAKPYKNVGYTCPAFAQHTMGNCILGFTYDGSVLYVTSRVSLWLPTGALDLALITQVAKLVGAKSAVWRITCAKLSGLKSLPSLTALGLKGPFIDKNKLVETGYGSKRTARFLSRGFTDSDGELPPIDFYEEFLSPDVEGGDITPDVLAKLAGVRGVEVRNFLRDELLMKQWGYATFYCGGDNYRWHTYADPMVKLIMAKFKIDPRKVQS